MILLTLIIGLVNATTTREWIKFPLGKDSPLQELFMNAPAEAVFVPTVREGFLPPVHYIERHAQGDEAADYARIRQEVLHAMGVEPFAKNTVDFRPEPFKAGEKRDLPASLTLVQSGGTESMLTCFAIVREGDLLRVLYTKGFQASLTDCKTPFVEIARSPVLFRK